MRIGPKTDPGGTLNRTAFGSDDEIDID